MRHEPSERKDGKRKAARRFRLGRLSDQSGMAVSIEFALIAPILLGLVFGVMEAGRLMFTQGVLYFAAQETTRFAMVTQPTGDPPDLAAYESLLSDFAKDKVIIIDPNLVRPTPAVDAVVDPATGTRTVSVQVAYDFEWMLPFVGDSGTITLTSTSEGFLAENF